jgi:hypothetical protein
MASTLENCSKICLSNVCLPYNGLLSMYLLKFVRARASSGHYSVQSRQFFASTLREQLFKLKNEDAIEKSKNLRSTSCAFHLERV